jgi:hypothetical protein
MWGFYSAASIKGVLDKPLLIMIASDVLDNENSESKS